MAQRLLTKKVLIIGSEGYIGSRLYQYLEPRYSVKKVDICWFNNITGFSRDYSSVSKEELAEFNVVILLAGHPSVQSCEGPLKGPWKNNVTNFIDLLSKINNQLLIYASSASVYGNQDSSCYYDETNTKFTPINNYDITKYVLDLHGLSAIKERKVLLGCGSEQ